jgi:nucleoside-triphosphatase THEP1
MRLSTGESEVFSMKEGFIPYSWEEEYRYDIYRFSKKGMDFARRITDDIINQDIDPVFIDEIGPLELQKKGLYDIFSQILRKRTRVYVSVRNSCLAHTIKFFNIHNYKIIEVIKQPLKS